MTRIYFFVIADRRASFKSLHFFWCIFAQQNEIINSITRK